MPVVSFMYLLQQHLCLFRCKLQFI